MTIISKCTRILLAFLAVICFVTIASFAFSSDVAFAESTEDTAVSVADSGEDVPEDAVVSLTNGETVTYYTSFSSALGDALGGATLTFLQDTEMGGFSGTEEMSKGFTLELNGKTVTYTGGEIRTANLTIQDSVGGGTIDIGSNRLYFYVSGNFNFKSGRIIGDKYRLNTWGSFTQMNLSGGRIETNIITSDNSAINMTDGYVESLLDASNKSKISGGIVNEFVAYGIAKKLSGGTFMSIRFQDVGVDFKGLLWDGYAYTAADGTGLIKPSDMTTSTAVIVVKCPHEAFTLDEQGQHVCDYCGYVCEHEKYDSNTHKCVLCGEDCVHESYNERGVCKACTYVCPHDNVVDNVCDVCKNSMNVSVQSGNEIKYFIDFQNVAAACADESKIVILNDMELKSSLLIDKSVTFDLNGKKLFACSVNFGSKATITDSVGGGFILISAIWPYDTADIELRGKDDTTFRVLKYTAKIKLYGGVLTKVLDNRGSMRDFLPERYMFVENGEPILWTEIDNISADYSGAITTQECTHALYDEDLVCKYCNYTLHTGEVIERVYDEINTAKSGLRSAIDNKADLATINELITNLNKAIANAETASKAYAADNDNVVKESMSATIASAKADAVQSANEALDAAKTQLSEKIELKASANEVNAAIAELNNAIATAETVSKAYADDKNAELKDELESKIEDSKAEVAAAINALSERLGAVESKIEENAQKTDTLQTVLIVFIVLLALANVATVVIFSLRKRR